ncbi:hypothetical protein [Borreliella garinii]|uniref:hypothetical protein n=1 Tax=Borreliella garinii TaxID=29519 RepID=UPI001AED4B41|nr:hypothetical protein [Borreliella garinii]
MLRMAMEIDNVLYSDFSSYDSLLDAVISSDSDSDSDSNNNDEVILTKIKEVENISNNK